MRFHNAVYPRFHVTFLEQMQRGQFERDAQRARFACLAATARKLGPGHTSALVVGHLLPMGVDSVVKAASSLSFLSRLDGVQRLALAVGTGRRGMAAIRDGLMGPSDRSNWARTWRGRFVAALLTAAFCTYTGTLGYKLVTERDPLLFLCGTSAMRAGPRQLTGRSLARQEARE